MARTTRRTKTHRTIVAALRDEIAHHEARGLQQAREIDLWRRKATDAERTVQAHGTRPAAYDPSRQRHVPLEFWKDADLLDLLHQIERNAIGVRAEASRRSGQLTYGRVGFPVPLYEQVLCEARGRGLIDREAGDSPLGLDPVGERADQAQTAQTDERL